MDNFSYIRPATLETPPPSSARSAARSMLLAGGTDLLGEMKDDLRAPERLVAIRHLSELQGIRPGRGGLRIGAATLLADIVESATVQQQAPLLAMAAGKVGTPQIRNMGDDRRQPLPASALLVLPEQLSVLQAWRQRLLFGDRRERLPRHPRGRAVVHRSSVGYCAGARRARRDRARSRPAAASGVVPIEKFFVTPEAGSDAREHPAAERDPHRDRGAERASRIEGDLRQGDGA